ncbi:hypothetical protein GTO27_07765 [Candidatus Bathyarchaeota archaeon]|nr:hypothetical protein [Candidatus Bathyarchaeota archaeon]
MKESEAEEGKTEESGSTDSLEDTEEETTEEAEEIQEKPAEEGQVEEREEEVEGEEEQLPSEEEPEPEPEVRREPEEEEIVEEKIYTIPLGKAWIVQSRKRSPRAMKIIKDFVKRHMKIETTRELEEEEEEPGRLIISNELNERVWRRGIQKPPRKVRIRAARDKKGNVTVYLAEGD